MQTAELKQLALKAIDDLKALDIVALDVHTLTTITDVMIICSGRSNRHVRSIAENVATTAKKNGIHYVHTEGEKESEWVIVDLGDVVVHVMQPAIRSFYNLEDLWTPVQEAREHAHTPHRRRS